MPEQGVASVGSKSQKQERAPRLPDSMVLPLLCPRLTWDDGSIWMPGPTPGILDWLSPTSDFTEEESGAQREGAICFVSHGRAVTGAHDSWLPGQCSAHHTMVPSQTRMDPDLETKGAEAFLGSAGLCQTMTWCEGLSCQLPSPHLPCPERERGRALRKWLQNFGSGPWTRWNQWGILFLC